jgi:hypothetical protein
LFFFFFFSIDGWSGVFLLRSQIPVSTRLFGPGSGANWRRWSSWWLWCYCLLAGGGWLPLLLLRLLLFWRLGCVGICSKRCIRHVDGPFPTRLQYDHARSLQGCIMIVIIELLTGGGLSRCRMGRQDLRQLIGAELDRIDTIRHFPVPRGVQLVISQGRIIIMIIIVVTVHGLGPQLVGVFFQERRVLALVRQVNGGGPGSGWPWNRTSAIMIIIVLLLLDTNPTKPNPSNQVGSTGTKVFVREFVNGRSRSGSFLLILLLLLLLGRIPNNKKATLFDEQLD